MIFVDFGLCSARRYETHEGLGNLETCGRNYLEIWILEIISNVILGIVVEVILDVILYAMRGPPTRQFIPAAVYKLSSLRSTSVTSFLQHGLSGVTLGAPSPHPTLHLLPSPPSRHLTLPPHPQSLPPAPAPSPHLPPIPDHPK